MKVPANYRRLEGSERFLAPGAVLLGPADLNETLSISIVVRRRPDAPKLPDMDYWTKTPPGQRKFISRQEFAERYGASQEDLGKVANFARSHGLTIVETSVAERTVVVSGNIKQISEAFAVELGLYESPTQKYRGRAGFIHLPIDIADVVKGVFGLDNRQVVHPGNVPLGASPLTPVEVAKLYNFPTTSNGNGQTIGILSFGGGYAKSDIQTFFTNLSLMTPDIKDVEVGRKNTQGASISDVNDDPCANRDPQKCCSGVLCDLENVLDIDVAGAVAQGASIVVYFAPNNEGGFLSAVKKAVHDNDNNPSVLSISWGGAETNLGIWSDDGIDNLNVAFQEAATIGITVFVESGDDGSDCRVKDSKAHVQYPASDPFVTACGGTTIENVILSKLSFNEVTWNDDSGVTGGGISDLSKHSAFALPSWQAGAGIPNSMNDGKQRRGIPDIAGNASSFSGYNLVLYGTQTILLKRTAGKNKGTTFGTIGGTSAVAPLYAGLVAIINSVLGNPVGYLNPTLYSIAGSNVFRDTNDGANNSFSFKITNPDGTTTAGTSPGYTSGPGWDACTGLGSIDGNALLAQLTELEPKLMPAITDVGDNVYFFARTPDGRILYKKAVFGKGFVGWFVVEGNGRINSAPAAASVGNHVYLVARGLDDEIFLNQADLDKPFNNFWSLMSDPIQTPPECVDLAVQLKSQMDKDCSIFQDPEDRARCQKDKDKQIAIIRAKQESAGCMDPLLTDFSPAVARVGNNVYFFAASFGGHVFYNRAVSGQSGVGWVEVEGNGLTDAAPAAAGVGNHVFVAIKGKGLDGHIFLNQADLDKPFNNFWSLMSDPIMTPECVDLAIQLKSQMDKDCSRFPDPEDRARCQKDKDKQIAIIRAKQESAGCVNPLRTDVAPALAGVGNSIYLFAKGIDGRIFYNKAVLGKSFVGWVEVDGNGRTNDAPAAGAVGTHVFVAIRGLDGHLYLNQADLDKPFNDFWDRMVGT